MPERPGGVEIATIVSRVCMGKSADLPTADGPDRRHRRDVGNRRLGVRPTLHQVFPLAFRLDVSRAGHHRAAASDAADGLAPATAYRSAEQQPAGTVPFP